jgi:Tol biopolymer transport system component
VRQSISVSACALIAISTASHAQGRTISNAYPAWSPDGTRIAFQSNRTGDHEIYVMNADGSGVRQLTDSDGLDVHPSWSPDGSRIVFASARTTQMYSSPGKLQIYVMDADGQHPVRLTNNQVNDYSPEWSPDGQRIAFLSDRDGIPEVYVMRLDGSQQTNVTAHLPKGTERGNPHWHPDGVHIVFDADTSRRYNIFSVKFDGTDFRQLTRGGNPVFAASLARTAPNLAYSESIGSNWEIMAAAADGSGAVNVTNDPGRDFWQSWSPDGRKLAFSSDRGGPFDIYVANRDGTGLVRLTNGSR